MGAIVYNNLPVISIKAIAAWVNNIAEVVWQQVTHLLTELTPS